MRLTSLAPLFLIPFASADWTIDFYQKDTDCKPDDSDSSRHSKPPDYAGTKTLTGNDPIDCDGGTVYQDGGKDSNAISIKGINDSGLVVHLFTAEGCSKDSYIGSTDEDACYVNGDLGEGPVNYVIVEQPPLCALGVPMGHAAIC
ncbi:MAG: hypothetical protein LQ342_006949 [Letrouitia transgressa]|nr:MAG: hypothetical protein LQ342_006949 [Letrouitia transgressa]